MSIARDIFLAAQETFYGTFGEAVVYTPKGGSPFTATMVLDQRDTEGEVADVRFLPDVITLLVLKSSFPGGNSGDTFAWRGTAYRVKERTRPDQLDINWIILAEKA